MFQGFSINYFQSSLIRIERRFIAVYPFNGKVERPRKFRPFEPSEKPPFEHFSRILFLSLHEGCNTMNQPLFIIFCHYEVVSLHQKLWQSLFNPSRHCEEATLFADEAISLQFFKILSTNL